MNDDKSDAWDEVRFTIVMMICAAVIVVSFIVAAYAGEKAPLAEYTLKLKAAEVDAIYGVIANLPRPDMANLADPILISIKRQVDEQNAIATKPEPPPEKPEPPK